MPLSTDLTDGSGSSGVGGHRSPRRRTLAGIVTAAATTAALLPTASSPAAANPGAAATDRAARTTINLTVAGCNGCVVQPVQNRRGQITYWGPKKTVRNGQVTLRVPTRRTSDMAFLIFAPFDEYAQAGIPAVAVTRFKSKKPGRTVPTTYVSTRRKASGCWAGTTRREVTNTLVVKQRRQAGRTVAAGWLKRTWRSGPYWQTVRGGSYHASDPSICR